MAENCADPVCSSKTDMFRMGVLGKKSKKKGTATAATTAAAPVDCPLDREELGRATWGLLHTTAAYYPDKPTQAQKNQATTFVESFAQLYPCKHCAGDFQENIKDTPPKQDMPVNSRIDFSLWMCDQHNRVTTKLDKTPFPCTIEALDQRWKTGVAACWAKHESTGETPEESLGQDV
ncbi:Aste57867_19994 [Aphanomyces stellatus]|uniref:Sulfhydryl oxidase n=1 Tax=Aphanomyces stellatus TaxID=120398 RepID=A0A485LDU3_9STRA|nr:hypothetical protein As57867_019928 [Aphanomyces stellatus]VFT96691.1 Aste57867_19994 [Aphanomyces stellatus]